jgi:hypothetical protein
VQLNKRLQQQALCSTCHARRSRCSSARLCGKGGAEGRQLGVRAHLVIELLEHLAHADVQRVRSEEERLRDKVEGVPAAGVCLVGIPIPGLSSGGGATRLVFVLYDAR